jgi:hypothetical protein
MNFSLKVDDTIISTGFVMMMVARVEMGHAGWLAKKSRTVDTK